MRIPYTKWEFSLLAYLFGREAGKGEKRVTSIRQGIFQSIYYYPEKKKNLRTGGNELYSSLHDSHSLNKCIVNKEMNEK